MRCLFRGADWQRDLGLEALIAAILAIEAANDTTKMMDEVNLLREGTVRDGT